MKIRVNRAWFDDQLRRGVGLGDIVKKVTNAVGMETCGKCEKRRQAMNRIRLPRIFGQG